MRGKYDEDEVYIFYLYVQGKLTRVIQYAFFRGSWYRSTNPVPSQDAETLVKEAHFKAQERIRQAKAYLKRRTSSQRTTQSKSVRDPIPAAVQRAVWRRDQGRCVVCGSNEKLEFDHIIPISKGGSNTERNIQLLGESCKRSKGSRIGS
jgi:5-methylcytosine-specific restriction endonuclease McrA